jgi:mRNA-degrading endonuclease RelE of RelBE toxin-antitoxin system
VTWRVEIQRSAEKELKRLSAQTRSRIVPVLRSLTETPFPHGVVKLQNRDGYTVDHAQNPVRITAVGHRRDV